MVSLLFCFEGGGYFRRDLHVYLEESLLFLFEQLSLCLEAESGLYKAVTKNSDCDHWFKSWLFQDPFKLELTDVSDIN